MNIDTILTTSREEKNAFDIIEKLYNRIKKMPTDCSLFMLFFNTEIKDWIEEYVGDIKEDNPNSLEVCNLSKIIIRSETLNAELELVFLLMNNKKENGKVELNIICENMIFTQYKNDFLNRKNEPIRTVNIEDFDQDIISSIYDMLFETEGSVDIFFIKEVELAIKQLIIEYMDICIKVKNLE